MTKVAKAMTAIGLAVTLSGCVTGGTATDMVTAGAGMQGLVTATQPPSKDDYALSCPVVNQRLGNLYARYTEVEREQRARQRQSAMIGGLIDVGATVVGGSAMANAGSAAGLRNAGLATDAGRSALGAVAGRESSTQQLKDVNDAMLIAQRIGQLEKVKFEKGC